MSYPETDRLLTAIKRGPDHVWLNDVSSVCLQQSLRDLQLRFSKFHDKDAPYPEFRRKNDTQYATYTDKGFAFDLNSHQLSLAKVGRLRVKWSRRLPVLPESVILIKRPSGKYYVSLLLEIANDEESIQKDSGAVSIGFHINRLATLSNGDRYSEPTKIHRLQSKFDSLQLKIKRCAQVSNRKKRLFIKSSRILEKIDSIRLDFTHKLCLDVVRRYSTIYIQDYENEIGTDNQRLSTSFSAVHEQQASRILVAKARRLGRRVLCINREYPLFRVCSACGFIHQPTLALQHTWTCLSCRKSHDLAENAVTILQAAGQAVTAHGDGIRSTRLKAG